MAKNKNKNTAPKADSIVDAPVTEVNDTTNSVSVVELGKLNDVTKMSQKTGLDPNRQVDLLTGLREMYHKDPDAAAKYGIPEEAVQKLNKITAIGYVAVLANEVMFSQSPFAVRMRVSQLEILKEVAPQIGVEIATKALPVLTPENAEEEVEIKSEDIKVSKQSQKEIKEEKKLLEKSVELDPTKIKSEEELKEALLTFLSKRDNVFENIEKAINFYSAYLQIGAKDNKEALEKVKKFTRRELLTQIADFVKSCPIVFRGIGNHMFTTTAVAKNPIAAFCSLRNTTKNKKTGVPSVEDSYIVDIVKVLITWSTKLKIEEQEQKINNTKKSIEVLSKDKKANKKAIDGATEKLETYENNIKHFKEVIDIVNDPDISNISDFETKYNEKDATTMRTFKAITDSYYADVDLKTVKKNCLVHNVHQYAGVIINMFKDPLARINNYSEANITELELIPQETEKIEESPKKD